MKLDMRYLILTLIISVLTGCSTADTNGSRTIREYDVQITNTNGFMFIKMPLDVTASTEDQTDQAPTNSASQEIRPNVSLAGQGATSSLATEGGKLLLDGVKNILDNKKTPLEETSSDESVNISKETETLPIDNDTEIELGPVTLKYHHYNPSSWNGKGSSIVMCEGDSFESCMVGDVEMVKHGSLDKGREVWTVYKTPGLSGSIICYDGESLKEAVVESSSMQYGDC